MNFLERWLVRRIIRKEVIQGYDHHLRITLLYQEIRKACEEEFTEDNVITLNAFLQERFQNTQRCGESYIPLKLR